MDITDDYGEFWLIFGPPIIVQGKDKSKKEIKRKIVPDTETGQEMSGDPNSNVAPPPPRPPPPAVQPPGPVPEHGTGYHHMIESSDADYRIDIFVMEACHIHVRVIYRPSGAIVMDFTKTNMKPEDKALLVNELKKRQTLRFGFSAPEVDGNVRFSARLTAPGSVSAGISFPNTIGSSLAKASPPRLKEGRDTFRVLSLVAIFLCSLASILSNAQLAHAQSDCWINAATGEAAPNVLPAGARRDPFNANRASRPSVPAGPNFPAVPGADFVRNPDGTWINAATGEAAPNVLPAGAGRDPFNANRASRPSVPAGPNFPAVPGADFVRLPCPPPPSPPTQTSWTGPFIGVQLAGVWSGVKTSENLASTGMRTNLFNDSGSALSGGINAGFNWQLPNSAFVVGGVMTLNGMNDTVTHNFFGGSSIGSTVNFTAAAEVRAGFLATPNVLIYAQTGIAVAQQTVQLNFGGATSSRSQLTPGYTLGAGVEWQPPISPLFPTTASPAGGWTMSVFAQYGHIWWDKATLNAPSASPFYNYGWSRQSDMFTVGVRFRY